MTTENRAGAGVVEGVMPGPARTQRIHLRLKSKGSDQIAERKGRHQRPDLPDDAQRVDPSYCFL